jgi:hypothetical protein
VNQADLLETLSTLYGEARWPKPLHILLGLKLHRARLQAREAAEAVGTTSREITAAASAADSVRHVLGAAPEELRASSSFAISGKDGRTPTTGSTTG